jgi:hypothetical protein
MVDLAAQIERLETISYDDLLRSDALESIAQELKIWLKIMCYFAREDHTPARSTIAKAEAIIEAYQKWKNHE